MSLKAEQRLLNHQFTEFEPKIYVTGASLVPMEIEMKGTKKFVWVAEEFNDDSFLDGSAISPKLIANSIDDLINK